MCANAMLTKKQKQMLVDYVNRNFYYGPYAEIRFFNTCFIIYYYEGNGERNYCETVRFNEDKNRLKQLLRDSYLFHIGGFSAVESLFDFLDDIKAKLNYIKQKHTQRFAPIPSPVPAFMNCVDDDDNLPF